HANSPRDALYRLDTMVAMANLNIPDKAVRQQIASAIEIVVQIARMTDGTRKVTAISEITGMEGEVITMQDLFVFDKAGVRPECMVCGGFPAPARWPGRRAFPRHRHTAQVRGAAGCFRNAAAC